MSEDKNKQELNSQGVKGYLLPAIVVIFSFAIIYTVVVAIPNLPSLKSNPSEYAIEYVEKDEKGLIKRDPKTGVPVLNHF